MSAEQRQLKPGQQRPIWTTTAEAMGMGLPKPSGTHISPPRATNGRGEGVGFNVCSAGFQSCFEVDSMHMSVAHEGICISIFPTSTYD